jgi:hypothetical protein
MLLLTKIRLPDVKWKATFDTLILGLCIEGQKHRNVKVKVHPRTCHKGTQTGSRSVAVLFLWPRR